MAAEALGVELPYLCLVAAHAWDTLGTQAAGCAAALVSLSNFASDHTSLRTFGNVVLAGKSAKGFLQVLWPETAA